MIACNSLNIDKLRIGQPLYLIRYSHVGYPDFTTVTYCGVEDDNIKYMNCSKNVKKLNITKIKHRLFSDKHEMSRSLYDCFLKRNVVLIDDYKLLFLKSQDARPELWI